MVAPELLTWSLLLLAATGFAKTAFAKTAEQASLESALRNTPAVGIALDLKSGRQVAVVHGQQAVNLRAEPGSILKPLFLNDALNGHEILPQTQVFCRRKLVIQDGNQKWNLDCTHPQTGTSFTAVEALAYSCNRYFVEMADRLSQAQLSLILERYGIPLPAPPATREKKELLVLGLSGIAVSPQQMALAYRKLALTWLPPVRDGLRDSVTYGMAHNAALDEMEIAGKTGTTLHGWFAGIGGGVVVVIYLPRGNGADAARMAQHFFQGLSQPDAPSKHEAASSGGAIRVGLFSTEAVRHITVSGQSIDWKPDGMHTPHGTIRKLSLSGMQHLVANGHLQAAAAGQWTISWKPGGLQTVLTLPTENYVSAALNGEAAPDEPEASLEALAVLIRTFAVVNAARHRAEGFQLCDSTHCQVMRLGAERPAVARAVHATAGETLWFGGRQAHVYFTEHCGGVREAAASVWPAEHAPYLQGMQADPYCVRRSSAVWQAHIPLGRLITIMHTQGWQVPTPMEDIRVAQRTASGRVSMLALIGQGLPAKVSAASFRFAVNRELGWNQIRSNWYNASISNGELVVEGKGYGHGSGLCQAGAFEMAVEGHSKQEILSFYFPGAVARISPSRGPWQRTAGNGWTLLTTAPDPALLASGNAMWAEAQSIFGPPRILLHPNVQELPTTELFRQVTMQPGWVLASTRGSDIFLQPATVRQAHVPTPDLLLHEFVHALVERESSDRTPLWLREGLVEVLASHNQNKRPNAWGSGSPLDLAVLEQELRRPSSLSASRQAHAMAAQLTASLCTRYSLSMVRGFLRNGVPPDAASTLQTQRPLSQVR